MDTHERHPMYKNVKIENHVFSGAIWFTGWLFTIGFVDLTFWKGVLALAIWPYYLGELIRSMLA